MCESFLANSWIHSHELFLLGPGEKKVTEEPDPRKSLIQCKHQPTSDTILGTPNCSFFVMNKEDHTLGNLFASRLHNYDYVTYSGYAMKHPLTPVVHLRVATDGSVTPREALLNCAKDILVDLDKVSREFTKEFELKKISAGPK
jgi:DNA-directed RNA polymerase II subunit RPB11